MFSRQRGSPVISRIRGLWLDGKNAIFLSKSPRMQAGDAAVQAGHLRVVRFRNIDPSRFVNGDREIQPTR
jgi:hypothetical protein